MRRAMLIAMMLPLAMSCAPRKQPRAATQPSTQPNVRTLSATLVTLHLCDVPARDAFAALFKQLKEGAPLPRLDFAKRELRVSLDLDNAPCLLALKEICRQTQTIPEQYTTGVVITSHARSTTRLATFPTTRGTVRAATQQFDPGMFTPWLNEPEVSWVDQPATIAGPFMFVPQFITSQGSIDFRWAQASRSQTQLRIRVMLEPGMRVYAHSAVMVVDEAVDDQAQSLVEDNPKMLMQPPGEVPPLIWEVNAPLRAFSGSRSIAILRGRMRVDFLVKTEQLEVDDLSSQQPREKRVGNLRIGIGVMEKRGDRLQLPVELFRDSLSADEWQRVRNFRDDRRGCRFLDAAGQPIPTQIAHWGDDDGSLRLHVYVMRRAGSADLPPAKLLWDLPTEVDSRSVPMKFRNIPIASLFKN